MTSLICPYCHTSNRPTARFCAHCAQPLRKRCPVCGAELPLRSRFCTRCGAPLTPPTSPTPSPPHITSSPPAGGTGRLAPQTMLANRYIILRRVGRGGMGAVYQAADAHIPGKMWAVKEMSEAAITDPLERQMARQTFRQEALMLATLNHPNLPRVADHFSERGRQYLVMDFIEGETLAERLEREGGGPLPLEDVLRWADQLCDVLGYLHSRTPPVIFRDIKPANVMITPAGDVKLIDFGIARIFKSGKSGDTQYFGTVGYAPHEQYGWGQTDARSDIYALGALLHHLLTGSDPTLHPFEFDDIGQLNPLVPEHVVRAIARALSEQPDERWQTAAEMRAALHGSATELPVRTAGGAPVSWASSPSSGTVSQGLPAPSASFTTTTTTRAPLVNSVGEVNWMRLALGAVGGSLLVIGSFFSFIPPLLGLLLGPWIGGVAGAFGILLGCVLNTFGVGWWGVVIGYTLLGVLPALMVKDRRRWPTTLMASVVASGTAALTVTLAVGIELGVEEWEEILPIVARASWAIMPTSVLLVPPLARLLLEPLRHRGWLWIKKDELGGIQ